jgi:DNA-binding transcriptional regulator YhcF (GntR family)
MARERRGRSLVEDVYEVLRSDILCGRRLPSSRLQLTELAEEHGVSLSVVREAVTRLATEDLVEATPQRGFRVRSISLEHLRDLTWVRTQVETLALRQSIAKGDVTWEANLVAAHHRLAVTPMYFEDGRGNTEWMAAHAAFHAARLRPPAARPRTAPPPALRRFRAVPILGRQPAAPPRPGARGRRAQGDLRCALAGSRPGRRPADPALEATARNLEAIAADVGTTDPTDVDAVIEDPGRRD